MRHGLIRLVRLFVVCGAFAAMGTGVIGCEEKSAKLLPPGKASAVEFSLLPESGQPVDETRNGVFVQYNWLTVLSLEETARAYAEIEGATLEYFDEQDRLVLTQHLGAREIQSLFGTHSLVPLGSVSAPYRFTRDENKPFRVVVTFQVSDPTRNSPVRLTRTFNALRRGN